MQYIDIPNQDTVLGEGMHVHYHLILEYMRVVLISCLFGNAGFIGRDNKKLKQVVSLNIIKFDSPTIYYQLKRYDLRRIFTVTELAIT